MVAYWIAQALWFIFALMTLGTGMLFIHVRFSMIGAQITRLFLR